MPGDQTKGWTRRGFLALTGVAALGAVAAAVVNACTRRSGAPIAAPEPTSAPLPTPSPSATPVTLIAPTPTPWAPPTATATPRPTATPDLRPTATATPTPAPPNPDRAKISYLLRRAGFGASQQELDRFAGMGLAATTDYLLDYEKADDSALDARLQALNLDLTKLQDLQRWWLLRMVYSQRPLQEKMTLFWHGLLTSGYSRVGRADRMWKQNELFRQQALGEFPVILKAVSRDPAMLVWLDSQNNRKGAPNENFARELMELFTMGVGNYTEKDVRESARAFTGWSLGNQGFFFNATQHDDGDKSFLGVTGNFNGDDIIDIIMRQPATGTYISRRLFSFFAHDDPEPEVLNGLSRTFRESRYSIKAVMREILTSQAFYSQKAYRSRPKSPAELVASTVRTLGMETDASALPVTLLRMGQTLFDPPNVAGWPGGATWINSSTLLERLNFANRVATDRKLFKPEEALEKAGLSPKQAVDYFLGLLLDGAVSPKERVTLDDYAQSVLKVAEADAALRSVAYLVLSSPDYQLA